MVEEDFELDFEEPDRVHPQSVTMADHSRSMFSTWVSLFLSLGSLAFAYIITITATTMAQPSFM